MTGPDFWKNNKRGQKLSEELAILKAKVEKLQKIEAQIKDLEELVDIFDDDRIVQEANEKYRSLKIELEKIKIKAKQADKYDYANAMIVISAGAGGVDAQDWAEMLVRMYLRFGEKAGFKVKLTARSAGSEAGIKSAVLEIKGREAYRIFKMEAGVHRLVRLSPYNANNLRQTSFSLVEVVPEIKEDELMVEDKDLRIDTFRSSGAGGQHVNTTDSAVRITHLLSGITAVCQSERSQSQNKDKAKKILAGKLYVLREKERKEKEKQAKGEYKSAKWGNQIRSYVLHPYKMVKDHRTGKKSGKVEEVLDGNLEIINSYR